MSTSPQIAEPNAPLDELMKRALRRFGEMSTSTVEGDASLVFIDYANEILDDIRGHAYWPSDEVILDYVSLTEQRAVPDRLMVIGLLARYAADQQSKKAGQYMNEYYGSLNRLLHLKKFGGSVELELGVLDKGEGGYSAG